MRVGTGARLRAAEDAAAELGLALGAACRGTRKPEPEPANAVELALLLLHRIGEDPGLRGSYRVAARRHFRQLARLMRDARP